MCLLTVYEEEKKYQINHSKQLLRKEKENNEEQQNAHCVCEREYFERLTSVKLLTNVNYACV